MSFHINWLRLASGSVWPAMVFQGAGNLATVLVLGFMAWRNRGKLPALG
jgi:hypothetical protein